MLSRRRCSYNASSSPLINSWHLLQVLCTVVSAQPPFGYAGMPSSPSKGALILGKHDKHWLLESG